MLQSILAYKLDIKKLDHFCFYNVVENETYFVFECRLYNFIEDGFLFLFQNVRWTYLIPNNNNQDICIFGWYVITCGSKNGHQKRLDYMLKI